VRVADAWPVGSWDLWRRPAVGVVVVGRNDCAVEVVVVGRNDCAVEVV
jgi:hypothetical protein